MGGDVSVGIDMPPSLCSTEMKLLVPVQAQICDSL